jgi:hypothetical protein
MPPKDKGKKPATPSPKDKAKQPATPASKDKGKKPAITTPKRIPKRKLPDTATKPEKKQRRAAEPQPLTSDDVRAAKKSNPPQCYVIGPRTSWVDNAKALAAYLGFQELDHFREWFTLKRSENRIPTPERILESFRAIHDANFGKPAKPGSTPRTNVARAAIWSQLEKNSQELMPQMQEDAR